MKIITGKTGTNHVASADDRALNAGIFGTDNYVLNVGSKFAITSETSNNFRIDDGELLINGTHARIPQGEHEMVYIKNGEPSLNRIDLIVARYTKAAGIENVELAVISPDGTTGTPTRPSYTKGNVLEGVEVAEMPLYEVRLSGVNIASITPLFTIATGFDDVYRKNEVEAIKTALQQSINTAQSTANTAKANAATAQSTANTARQEAAAAQTKANSADSKANAATSLAQANAAEIQNVETSLLETINSMQQALQSQINTINDRLKYLEQK